MECRPRIYLDKYQSVFGGQDYQTTINECLSASNGDHKLEIKLKW